jgi:beta-phosphoglucomutase-like phosphatase (HAD superfamily)
MLKALLFDLDGTLADTNSVHRLTWVKTLEPYGYDVTWDFYRDRINGRLTPEVVTDLFPDLLPEEVQTIVYTKESNFRERAGELEPLPGLLDFIRKGREKWVSPSSPTRPRRTFPPSCVLWGSKALSSP